MDDPLPVRRFERVCDLPRDRQRFINRKPMGVGRQALGLGLCRVVYAAPRNERREVLALDEFHHSEGRWGRQAWQGGPGFQSVDTTIGYRYRARQRPSAAPRQPNCPRMVWQRNLPRVTFRPIPSLWGHTAGAASNPEDWKLLNDNIAQVLNLH